MAHAKTAMLMALVLALPACVSGEAFRNQKAANEALRRQLTDLTDHQKALEAENRRLAAEVERLGKNAVEAGYIEKQKKKLARLIEEYSKGGALAIEGVTPIVRPEGMGFQVQGGVLFASGKAQVTAEGRKTLDQLVETLKRHGRTVRIDGHTDTDPIRYSKWKTNLRLSAERALAVADYLISRGIPAERVAIAGFGEHRPAVTGDTPEVKRRNRRVEILMLNE